MGKSAGFNAGVILKIVVILFILFLGLTDITKGGSIGSTNPFAIESITGNVGKAIGEAGKSKNLSTIFGIIEVLCAAFLCIAMFVDLKGITPIVSLIIMIAWAVRTILVSFVWNTLSKNPNVGDVFSWLVILLLQLVVLAALWGTGSKKS
jgi:flagellin-like protein